MINALKVILLVTCIVIIVAVLMQESKSDGLSSSIAGGAEQLFGKKKSQGYQGILNKITCVASVAFLGVSIGLLILS